MLQRASIIIIMGATMMLGGCAKPSIVHYNPNDFVNPNKVIIKKEPVPTPIPNIKASFDLGNNPDVIKAYNAFRKSGKARNIQSDGFVTLPYDDYAHPIIACEPLYLCVLQLERNETINNIDLGDSAHWLVSTSLVGTPRNGSYQIAIKPKVYNSATDMVITTNKRTYNIGLVSKRGEHTHVTNFYYPQESLNAAIHNAHQLATSELQTEIIDTSPTIHLRQLNFNYQLSGNHPVWQPLQVFDDGNKTFIRMPSIANHVDLPVLYILKRKHMQLVNYRYQRPYYIVDTLFKKAVLVSGKGHEQVKVIIDNRQLV